MRGATLRAASVGVERDISIHAPRAGRDNFFRLRRGLSGDFNPRAPCGARLASIIRCKGTNIFQSTRPVRGATVRSVGQRLQPRISIHAPRAGRDQGDTVSLKMSLYFNPRAPCGARHATSRAAPSFSLFQSTRPVRGATMLEAISEPVVLFQSTRPVRGATPAPLFPAPNEKISIHAPRAGRDSPTRLTTRPIRYFNPRAPCGARPSFWSMLFETRIFQSTRPVRGATRGRASTPTSASTFQSTRPVRGATRRSLLQGGYYTHFNPRAPCGARL